MKKNGEIKTGHREWIRTDVPDLPDEDEGNEEDGGIWEMVGVLC